MRVNLILPKISTDDKGIDVATSSSSVLGETHIKCKTLSLFKQCNYLEFVFCFLPLEPLHATNQAIVFI